MPLGQTHLLGQVQPEVCHLNKSYGHVFKTLQSYTPCAFTFLILMNHKHIAGRILDKLER